VLINYLSTIADNLPYETCRLRDNLFEMETTAPVFEDIWLADDDCDDCELFREVISQLLPDAQLTVVCNGEELLERLKNHDRPDCLFLDINMPLMDGLESLLEIRAQRVYRNLPIIIFSSTEQPSHLETSYQYGANLFYTKPSTFAELSGGLSTIFKMNWKDPGESFTFDPQQKFQPVLRNK
jgi:CheY-like chemotaxis protein